MRSGSENSPRPIVAVIFHNCIEEGLGLAPSFAKNTMHDVVLKIQQTQLPGGLCLHPQTPPNLDKVATTLARKFSEIPAEQVAGVAESAAP